ncbi:hypothetical protein NDU88_001941 [Pleurodeles waltl]|uniref:Secreted protein n=1 Tax=Pleurodeles waltl TaxID=8319 RepID=A0AAV7VXV2_PLEWA|nr:hypothetical protein NDU88_001941 [Pleurodeles waltl]
MCVIIAVAVYRGRGGVLAVFCTAIGLHCFREHYFICLFRSYDVQTTFALFMLHIVIDEAVFQVAQFYLVHLFVLSIST